MNFPISVVRRGNVLPVVMICLCTIVSGQRAPETRAGIHDVIARSQGLIVYRLQVEPAQVTGTHRHQGVTLLIPVHDAEILEGIQTSREAPATWKSRVSTASFNAGTVHTFFNPTSHGFAAIEIELAREDSIYLIPRFSNKASFQQVDVGGVVVGRYLIPKGGRFIPPQRCNGVVINPERVALTVTLTGAASPWNPGVVDSQAVVSIENSTSSAVQVLTLCQSTSDMKQDRHD